MIGWILFLLLLVFMLGAVPAWPYSRSWGYFPSGVLGLLVIVMMVLLISGYFQT